MVMQHGGECGIIFFSGLAAKVLKAKTVFLVSLLKDAFDSFCVAIFVTANFGGRRIYLFFGRKKITVLIISYQQWQRDWSLYVDNMLLFDSLSTHADRQGVDTSFVFVCNFVRMRISLSRIKLAASNFARRFIGVRGRESHIWGTLLPQEPKIGRIGQRAGHAHPDVIITAEMHPSKRHARDVQIISCGVWT